MEIYVDELPIKVAQRVIYFEDGKLNCVELMFDSSYEPEEIKLISDRLVEERKKVVQEIKDKISDGLYRNSYGETFIDGDIYEILDQIERGER